MNNRNLRVVKGLSKKAERYTNMRERERQRISADTFIQHSEGWCLAVKCGELANNDTFYSQQ